MDENNDKMRYTLESEDEMAQPQPMQSPAQPETAEPEAAQTDIDRASIPDKKTRRKIFLLLAAVALVAALGGSALTAVIRALAALREPCLVTLTTDSKYVCDAVTKGWVYGWQRKGWRKADGKPALNVDLWQQLLPLLQTHTVTFNWVKGHAGHPYNERCDALAVQEYTKHK